MAYTRLQLLQLAQGAGFPYETARKMAAIAWRESRGIPTAYNGTAPDSSYGLWQLNLYRAPERFALFGITDAKQLFDPVVNARGAFRLWAGNDANLARHWYIDRPGPLYFYQERYLSALADLDKEIAAAGVRPVEITGGGGSTATPETVGSFLSIDAAAANPLASFFPAGTGLSDAELLGVGLVAAVALLALA